jgi:hypothetical protein
MKKVILGGIVAIVIAVLAAVNVSLNSQRENLLSDLALANVEALAQNEGGGGTNCTVIGHTEIWSGACKYYCEICADGHYRALYVIYCLAK